MIEASYFLLYHDYPVTKMAKVFVALSRSWLRPCTCEEDRTCHSDILTASGLRPFHIKNIERNNQAQAMERQTAWEIG